MATKTTKTTTKPKAQVKAKPSCRSKKPAATATVSAEPKAPRATNEQMVIQTLSRLEDATLTELMELTGWRHHSLRGFLSGTAKKKLGLTVERITEDRTVYRVPSVPV
jgi:hypothetical protein